MFAKYWLSALNVAQLPEAKGEETVLIGRSNVGKSSLINALFNAKKLAFTAKTPGKTQLVNFFETDFGVIIDLPGYGFSRVSDNIRKHWQTMADAVLKRPSLVRVLFLFDPRRDWEELDIELLNILNYQKEVIIVFTKADKLKKQDHRMRVEKLIKDLQTSAPNLAKTCSVNVVSSLKKTGIEELLVRLKCFRG